MKLPNVPEKPPSEVLPPMSRRTLLQKYEIPVDHLDFKYVRECCDAKEVERIVRILRSGEEGYFPDLQACSEKRLNELNPDSKLLREEVPVMQVDALPADERKQLQGEMIDWMKDITEKNKVLRNEATAIQGVDIPNIREQKTTGKESKTSSQTKKSERIKSCDYDQWDKYDVDTELTRLDLKEERNREASEAAAKRNVKTIDKLVNDAESDLGNQTARMNPVERELCANRLRIQGNEHYKAGDYAEAVAEYTRSLTVVKTAVALANRAMAYLKLHENAKAIRDCDESLQLDGKNVKVMLRKAQALMNEDRRVEAYRVYNQVLKIDSKNGVALKSVAQLRETIGDLPPENAFRMKIEDDSTNTVVKPKDYNQKKPVAPIPMANTSTTKSKPPSKTAKDDDFAQLIIPKKIVPSKLATMAQTMGNMAKANQSTPRVPKPAPGVQTKPIPSQKAPVDIKMPFETKPPKKTTKYRNGVIIEEL